jgi:hypothetical protein
MTKDQKSLSKTLKKPTHRRAFLDLLRAQQREMGRYLHWETAYKKKCLKKGVPHPDVPLAKVG